jgi:hypothetical protein
VETSGELLQLRKSKSLETEMRWVFCGRADGELPFMLAASVGIFWGNEGQGITGGHSLKTVLWCDPNHTASAFDRIWRVFGIKDQAARGDDAFGIRVGSVHLRDGDS